MRKYINVVLEVDAQVAEEWIESRKEDFRIKDHEVVYLNRIQRKNCLLQDGRVVYGDDMVRLKPWESSKKEDRFFASADLKMNFYSGVVYKGDELLSLSNTSMRLLECFIRNVNRILTREQLLSNLEAIGKSNLYNNSLNVYVYRLRNSLGQFQGQNYIRTCNGLGYTWNFEVK